MISLMIPLKMSRLPSLSVVCSHHMGSTSNIFILHDHHHIKNMTEQKDEHNALSLGSPHPVLLETRAHSSMAIGYRHKHPNTQHAQEALHSPCT